MNSPRSSFDRDGRMKFAGQRPQQTHNSQTWESAVGGMRSTMRAIYGSTDRATVDHSNDALCHIVTRELHTTDEPRRIDRQFSSTIDHITTTVPPTVEQITTWARRAERMGMTVESYARDVLHLAL